MTSGDSFLVSLCEQYGIVFREVPNDPIGGKHNVALSIAQEEPWDAAIFLPSDDFTCARWVEEANDQIAKGVEYIMPSACGMFDMPTGRACVLTCRSHGSRKFGAGRVISRAAIDAIGPLWTHSKQRGLDSDSHARLMAAGYQMYVPEVDYLPVTDVKTKDNLWGYDTWKRGTKDAKPSEVLWMLSEEHRRRILSP